MKNKKLIISIIIFLVVIFVGCFVFLNSKKPTEEQNKIETTVEEIPDSSTEINENMLESEGFEEVNDELAGASNEDSKNTEELIAASSQRVYYSQLDSRWRYKPYTSCGNSKQTIGTSGCGPTSAAMVVSSIKGVVYPDTMADLYVKNGFRTANNGTYLSAFQWTANYYGIEFTRTSNLDTAVNLLNNGYIMVASCGSGLFTTDGHLIAIMGISGDTLIIHDPFLYNGKFDINGRSGKVTVSGTTVYCSIENFRNYANCSNFFAYKTNGGSTPVTPTPSVTTTTKYVSTKAGLNVRSGPSINYSIIRTLPVNTQVTVYEDSNGWSKIGEGQYVSSQYLSNTMVDTGSSSSIPNTVGKYYRLKQTSYIYANSSMNGTKYTYLANTQIKVLSNINSSVDYIQVVQTGRKGYIYKSNYTSSSSSSSTTSYKSTVGKYYRFANNTIIYSNSNLTGKQYNYLPNTQVKVLFHASTSVDYIQVVQTGRKGYVKVSSYK